MSRGDEIGMDHLTLLDVPPPELVTVARKAGFDAVGVRVSAAGPDEEPWPMNPGSPMLQETLRRARDTGVRVLGVELLRIGPGTEREDYEQTLESGARLGARYVIVNSDDPDLDRATDTFAALTADAKPYGLRPLLEPIPYTRVSNLEDAVSVAERSGGGGILLDSLHFYRYGGNLEQLRALDPGLLSYVQLCDAPLAPPDGLQRPDRMPRGQSVEGTDLQLESRAMRLLPGDGELPLARFLAALPAELPVSAEIPNLALRESLTPVEFARQARAAIADVLESG